MNKYDSLLLLLAILSSLVASTSGWGFTGHELIATIASDHLSPEATRKISGILGGRNLSSIASWADKIKWVEQYKFSSELHYINNDRDDPPGVCALKWQSPGRQEIIAAIYNYTTILRIAPSGSWRQSEALRFLVHYLGDMHQPLHCLSARQFITMAGLILIVSGKARGGNDFPVQFDGRRTNLHAVWDRLGLEKRIRSISATSESYRQQQAFRGHTALFGDTNRSATIGSNQLDMVESPISIYTSYVRELIVSDYFQPQVALWLRCPHTSVNPTFGCAEIWAEEINHLNCQYVWHKVDDDDELSSAYWQQIEKDLVIETLVMKSAIRLASVLNAVFS